MTNNEVNERCGTMTVTDAWRKRNHQFKNGCINLIVAPVGSGKTYFVFEELLKDYIKNNSLDEVLYLCDTSALRDAVKLDASYKDKCKYYYDKNIDSCIHHGFGIQTQDNRVTVMTYSLFGKLLEDNCMIFDGIKCIVCDEAHNLVKYMQRFDDDENKTYTVALHYLLLFANTKQVTMMTATHRRILGYQNEYEFPYSLHEFTDNQIMQLYESHTFFYDNYRNLSNILKTYNGFKYGKKAIIYTDKITTIHNLVQMFKDNDINSIGIWSKQNEKYPMTNEQLEARSTLIERGRLPDDIDVLIINASYETGINIHDERVDIMIINSTDPDTIIQARGRVRHDLTDLFVLTKDKCKWQVLLYKFWQIKIHSFYLPFLYVCYASCSCKKFFLCSNR